MPIRKSAAQQVQETCATIGVSLSVSINQYATSGDGATHCVRWGGLSALGGFADRNLGRCPRLA
jgi:hypothetical protein